MQNLTRCKKLIPNLTRRKSLISNSCFLQKLFHSKKCFLEKILHSESCFLEIFLFTKSCFLKLPGKRKICAFYVVLIVFCVQNLIFCVHFFFKICFSKLNFSLKSCLLRKIFIQNHGF